MPFCFSRGALLAATVAVSTNSTATPTDHADTGDSAAPMQMAALNLETLQVTASRTAMDLASVLASVDVIERDDIIRLQSHDMMELIGRVAGADVNRAGGPGANTSLFLRGTNSDHTLFLLDGQRISSATLGSTNIQFIDPEAVERIEIVRGPRSSLYGSEAIGGVVQIFTRTPGGEPGAYIKAGIGNNQSQRIAVGGETRLDQWRMGAYYSYYDTDGIDHTINEQGLNGDDDAYRNHSLTLKLGYDFGNGGSFDLNHFQTRAKNEMDDTFSPMAAPYSENWIQSSLATLRWPITTHWESHLSVGRAIDDSDNFAKYDPTQRSHFRTSRDSASWQNNFAIDDQQTIVAGIDHYEETIDTSSDFFDADGQPVHERDNIGYFAQYLLDASPVDVQIAVRQDDNDSFGKKSTGNLAWGFELPLDTKLIVSYGKGFKAPTFNDLYWPATPWSRGNPDLKPETSDNYEVELRGQHGGWYWSLVAFRNEIENLIAWAPVDPTDPWSAYTPSNVSEAEIEGATLSLDADIAGWQLRAAFSYVDPRDKATDTVLLNRSQRTLSVDIDRPFGQWDIGASWRLQDHRYADQLNARKLDGYGVVDLRAGYHVDEHWHLQLKVDNVFDRDYMVRENYNQEELTWFATVTYRL